MKKLIWIFIGIILAGSLLGGCGKKASIGDTTDKIGPDNGEAPQYQSFLAEVIDTANGLLVTPEEGSDAYRSSDRIYVGINNAVIRDEEGKEMTAEELSAGDMVMIYYNGVIAESYPAQITASELEYIGRDLLLDGYMALIDDIYGEDSGLNGDITMIAFDTTEWVGLSEIEKEIILSLAKEKYGLDTLQGTFDELAEQGLIDKENLYFEKGILIELKVVEYQAEDTIIKCSVKKWRSGKGAIGADATAEYTDGAWKITKTNPWIS